MQQYCKSIAIHIYLPSYCHLYIQPKIIISHSVNSDFKSVVLIYNNRVQYVKKKNQNVKYKEYLKSTTFEKDWFLSGENGNSITMAVYRCRDDGILSS